MVHLHCRSWFSFLAGGSAPEALAARAKALGQPALALTDCHGVYGAVRFAQACREAGLRPVFGATVTVVEEGAAHPLVLLARNAGGYENLCRLLTACHANDPRRTPAVEAADAPADLPARPTPPPAAVDGPHLRAAELQACARDHLVCLTGGPEGRLGTLLRRRQATAALRWLHRLAALFPDRLYVELVHRLQPDDGVLLEEMARMAARHGLPLVATNAVRHAAPDGFPRYDALTCARLGLTVGDRHPERPVNDSASLVDEAALRPLIPYPQAFENTERIAAECAMELLPGEITPPTALLPPGQDAATWLRHLCMEGLRQRYRPMQQPAALRQLEHELDVVTGLDLSEFFLVVHEVTSYARARGIRCAGRGSAANSIIAYCLAITTVDPLAHRLLFERFLHRGRKGMPDIDVDFDSERRPEVIAWMERRFGAQHTAMTANVNTYRAKSAIRDMMKVLGWDLETVGRVTKILSHYDGVTTVAERRAEIAEIVGGDTPLLDVLFQLVAGLKGCPRHLSLHNGGMILSRAPLARHSPLQISANGVRQIQFDKDDAEALGLVKFDVLGLRILAVVSEALTLHEADGGVPIDLEGIPVDDVETFELIRRGQTMSVFQIESPGQWNLLSRTQPKNFDDLVVEVALFRPGPLQGGMVNPYVARVNGRAPVTYPHPSLEPILRDTRGIILYQEQVLEVSHQFAGMSLEEADRFRSLMSKWRDPGDMSAMGERFVSGAMARHGVPEALARQVFDQVAAFVGYGFCRSHAAAFARVVYETAWLKAHHPAPYMAAVLQHQPGFYPMSTVLEEVKHLGVPIRPVDVWRSTARYRVEGGAIRIPLTRVKGMSAPLAEALVAGRARCATLEQLRREVALPADVWDALARAGAFDPAYGVDPRGAGAGTARRDALWRMGLRQRGGETLFEMTEPEQIPRPSVGESELHLTINPSGLIPRPSVGESELHLTINPSGLIPELDPMAEDLTVAWDFATMELSGRTHPVALHRALLQRRGVRLVRELRTLSAGRSVQVAGIVVTVQRPPTAKGMLFLVLEDETGRLPVAVTPPVWARHVRALRAATLLVEGRLEQSGAGYRSVLLTRAWPLDGIVRAEAAR